MFGTWALVFIPNNVRRPGTIENSFAARAAHERQRTAVMAAAPRHPAPVAAAHLCHRAVHGRLSGAGLLVVPARTVVRSPVPRTGQRAGRTPALSALRLSVSAARAEQSRHQLHQSV